MSTTFVIKPSQRYSRTLSITDDSGMQGFEVDYGSRWRPINTNRVSIRDTAGTEVAVISRAGLIHLELLVGGQRITMRPAGFNSRKLKITSAGDRLEVVGDHRQGGTFSIIRGGMSAATVTFGQQSTVAITDGEDPVLMLGLALTIARISSGLAAQQLAMRRI